MQATEDGSESGQAAVESALILPMQIFLVLGILQLSLAYHARLMAEYSAFAAARAASVFRLDCDRILQAALVPLVPTFGRVGEGQDLTARIPALARQVISNNRPIQGANIPLVIVDYAVRGAAGRFDRPLNPLSGPNPKEVSVKVIYFFEYRVPFAGDLITRYWLATQPGTSAQWAQGADPIMLIQEARNAPKTGSLNSQLVTIAQLAKDQNYKTAPIITTWTMRMMSDPLPGAGLPDAQCLQ